MPRAVRIGLALYVTAALLTPIVGLFDPVPVGAVPGPGIPGMLAVLAPVFALKALLIYKAFRGRSWARIGLAAFTGIGLAAYAPGLVHSLRTEPLIGVVDLLLVLAEAVAVILLFTPDSNRWYRAGAPAMMGR